MFPYVMIAVMPIFSDSDWPKRCLTKIPKLYPVFFSDSPPGRNSACLYSDEKSIEKDYDSVSMLNDYQFHI